MLSRSQYLLLSRSLYTNEALANAMQKYKVETKQIKTIIETYTEKQNTRCAVHPVPKKLVSKKKKNHNDSGGLTPKDKKNTIMVILHQTYTTVCE